MSDQIRIRKHLSMKKQVRIIRLRMSQTKRTPPNEKTCTCKNKTPAQFEKSGYA